MPELTQTEFPAAAPANLSKRRLIDTITSLDNAFKEPTGGAQAAKKRKMNTTASAPRTSTPALEALLARTASPGPSTPSNAPPPASYEPTSLPALLSRLQTYSRLSSFSPSKPASLSSLNCALHGWKHTPSTRERVECVTCGRAVVLLPPSAGTGGWTSEAGKNLRGEYEMALFSREATESLHKETCPWRMRPCARSLYRLPGGGLGVPAGSGGGGRRRLLEDVSKIAADMEEKGLGEMQVELPKEAEKLVGGDEARARLVLAIEGALPPTPSGESEQPRPAQLSATSILLALFGWTLPSLSSSSSRPGTPSLSRSASSTSISSLSSVASTSKATSVLSCAFCHRQVLASSYLPTSPSPKSFDLVKQHHSFCPYVASASSGPLQPSSTAHAAPAPPALKPGWQIRLEAVLGAGAAARSAASTQSGAAQEVDGQQGTRLVEQGKTQDLLRYVRSLLGPKPKARIAPVLPQPIRSNSASETS
ncbi:hypothetical protein JCM11251_001894 [Rhodosporidiobolus azoricus]